MSTNLHAAAPEAKDESPQSISLSAIIPVVQRELTVQLALADSQHQAAADLSCTIVTDGGETVFQGPAERQGDRYIARWTPDATGFHTVIFSRSEQELGRRRFPVVWRDLHFVLWPRPTLDFAQQFPYLTSTVITGDGDAQAWKELGRRVLGTVYHRSKYIASYYEQGDHDGAVERLAEQWAAPLEEGADGIFIDELAVYPNAAGLWHTRVVADALSRIRERYPDAWIFPAVGGALLTEQALAFKASDSVALLETYPEFVISAFGAHRYDSYLEHRVEVARHADLIFERGYRHGEEAQNPATWRKHGAVMLLSMNTVGRGVLEEPAVARLEKQVRQIKQTAPEMPGIGFYGSGSAAGYHREHGLLDAAERLIERYYIKPVISVRDIYVDEYQPAAGTANRIHVGVNNLGGMDAEGVRVEVYARHQISNEAELVGTLHIERLGTGFGALTKQDAERSFEFQKVDGDRYVVLEGGNTIFRARTTRSIDWTPRREGPYEITAVVQPSPAYTLLDGVMTQDLVVAQAASGAGE